MKKKGTGGDYADTHARYDYVTLNHFTDIPDGANARGVTLANADCASRLGRSTPTTLDIVTPQINVLAGGQVDGPRLGITGQNGTDRFLQRFALLPHAAYDPVAAMRFAVEYQNRFVTGPVGGTPSSPYPAECYSLLTVDDPAVLLWTLKPHEDGIANGVVARVWNVSDTTVTSTLSLTPGLAAAVSATHIETDLKQLPVTGNRVAVALAPCQLQTLRLVLPHLASLGNSLARTDEACDPSLDMPRACGPFQKPRRAFCTLEAPVAGLQLQFPGAENRLAEKLDGDQYGDFVVDIKLGLVRPHNPLQQILALGRLPLLRMTAATIDRSIRLFRTAVATTGMDSNPANFTTNTSMSWLLSSMQSAPRKAGAISRNSSIPARADRPAAVGWRRGSWGSEPGCSTADPVGVGFRRVAESS